MEICDHCGKEVSKEVINCVEVHKIYSKTGRTLWRGYLCPKCFSLFQTMNNMFFGAYLNGHTELERGYTPKTHGLILQEIMKFDTVVSKYKSKGMSREEAERKAREDMKD